MLLFLMPDGKAESVKRVFDYLETGLGIEVFRRLFPVVLTDNAGEVEHVPNGRTPNEVSFIDFFIIPFMNDRLPFFGMKIPFTFRSFLHSLLMMLDACSSSVFTDANASFFIFFPIDRWSRLSQVLPNTTPDRYSNAIISVILFSGRPSMLAAATVRRVRIFFVCEIVQLCNQFFRIPFCQFV